MSYYKKLFSKIYHRPSIATFSKNFSNTDFDKKPPAKISQNLGINWTSKKIPYSI